MATVDSFSLPHFESRFVTDAGLRRSVDKMYEIVVYALFSTLVRALRAEVTVRVANADRRILQDFAGFLTTVPGLDADHAERTFPAALYRAGVTNPADWGLDIWANFGPAVQVKHLTLTADLVEDITGQITADRIVVVCRDAEREPIDALLAQVGWSDRLQGILTLHDLDQWYRLSLSPAYRHDLGRLLLSDLLREFDAEFPSCELLAPFLEERGYADIPLTGAPFDSFRDERLCLLHDPFRVRPTRRRRHDHFSRFHAEEDQQIQFLDSAGRDRLHREEITGPQRILMPFEKVAPFVGHPIRCRFDPACGATRW